MIHHPTRHTVSRSVGNRIEQEQEHTRPGAAYRFAVECERVVRSFGMADTRGGAEFMRRANRVADSIAAGDVAEAAVTFQGERVTFAHATAARAQRVAA